MYAEIVISQQSKKQKKRTKKNIKVRNC